MSIGRILLLGYTIVFIGLCAASALFFARTYQEFSILRAQEADNVRRLVEAERRLQDQQLVLERLRGDPAFVERMIRERLGYAKNDELVFRFER
jgi:cell division protein DivIC